MRPLHDVDVLVLMATALAAKRRPAELVEIVAAADLIQGAVPFPEKLGEALRRLSVNGLIVAAENGFALTPAAQALMADEPRRADTEARIAALRGKLADHEAGPACAPVVLTDDELDAAVRAHKAARKAPGKNLLMPKPKPDRHFKVEGRWRRAPARKP